MHIYTNYNSEVNPINATTASNKVSDKYQLIRTDKVIEVFQDNGLQVVGQSFGKPRNQENIGFQKHLTAFSDDKYNIGEEQLQLLLKNSHNGTSSFQLDLGCFRFACANGLVVGSSESSVSIRHTKNALDKLDKAIQYQLDRLPYIATKIIDFKNYQVEPDKLPVLVGALASIRAGQVVTKLGKISIKRTEDSANNGTFNLWQVFNVIQELSIKGGLVYFDNEKNEWKKTRKISSVDKVIKLNKELWNVAEHFKTAA